MYQSSGLAIGRRRSTRFMGDSGVLGESFIGDKAYHVLGSTAVPPDKRALALNDLACIAYEDRSLDSNVMYDIEVHEPLRSWLSAHTNEDLS